MATQKTTAVDPIRAAAQGNPRTLAILDHIDTHNAKATIYTTVTTWELSKSGKTLTLNLADGTVVKQPMQTIFPEESRDDLTTRKRVQVVLDRGLYAQLQTYSKESGTPVSRLLDEAIKKSYGFES